jgi:predicted 3-demethylubiquinone-9 3-methyltransferase (glyoxalase superfamily)
MQRPAAFALIEHKEHTNMKPKNTICLWFDKDAHEAARFYAVTFPDSKVTAVHEAPGDYPGGKKGDVLTVEFTVLGIPCLGLNGGPAFRHTEAFSFQIATENQEETDRYWNAIVGNGGTESQCGWCKDRWGLSWQITPRALTDALAAGGGEAKRAFEAMMTMKKIDSAAVEADVNTPTRPYSSWITRDPEVVGIPDLCACGPNGVLESVCLHASGASSNLTNQTLDG